MSGYDFRAESTRNFHKIINKWGKSAEKIEENWEQIMQDYEETYGEEFFIEFEADIDYWIQEALKYREE